MSTRLPISRTDGPSAPGHLRPLLSSGLATSLAAFLVLGAGIGVSAVAAPTATPAKAAVDPTTVVTLDHIHSSGYNGTSYAVTEKDIDDFMAKSNIVTMTEVREPARAEVLKEDGWNRIWIRGDNDTGISVRNSDWAVVDQFEKKLTDKTYYRVGGDKPIPLIGLFGVISSKVTGEKFLITVAHMPSSVEGNGGFDNDVPNRVEVYKDGIKGWRSLTEAAEAKYQTSGTLVIADWNLDIKEKWVEDYITGAWGSGYALTLDKPYPTRGTHGSGGRIIDFSLEKGLVVDKPENPMGDIDSSDHHPYSEGLLPKSSLDEDNDGLTAYAEGYYGTKPKSPDTDGDGLSDGVEVKKYATDPTKADTDGDGLNDSAELKTYKTDPKNPDTDSDGLSDGQEIQATTNPKKPDTDDDGLGDGDEVNRFGTDPKNADTDEDTLSDGVEVNEYHTDPLKADTDGDTLDDAFEINDFGTNPLKADTDGDQLPDNQERDYRTDPNNPDTDGDSLTDGNEINNRGTDPLKADTDKDDLDDGVEINKTRTNPIKADTDGDSLKDGAEVTGPSAKYSKVKTDPLVADTDKDGLDDGVEVKKYQTNPANPDTDGDGRKDGREIQVGKDPLKKD